MVKEWGERGKWVRKEDNGRHTADREGGMS